MDLWIRSQDKFNLVKVINIAYGGFNDRRGAIIECNDGVELGIYTTKERTLEVLDEIHDYINGIKKDWNMTTGYYEKTIVNSKVYQMPKE